MKSSAMRWQKALWLVDVCVCVCVRVCMCCDTVMLVASCDLIVFFFVPCVPTEWVLLPLFCPVCVPN